MIDLSFVAFLFGGAAAITLIRLLLNHYLGRGDPEAFSWLRVTYLGLGIAAMVIVGFGL
jgi:hypothetical protein